MIDELLGQEEKAEAQQQPMALSPKTLAPLPGVAPAERVHEVTVEAQGTDPAVLETIPAAEGAPRCTPLQ